MNRCHQKTCVQEGILECENCKRNGFPPLRYCSQTCALEILPQHNRIWHPIETTYVLQAIPLVEVRDQEAKQATFLFTPLGRALVQKMCLENKKGVRIVSIKGLSRAGKSSRMCWLLRMLGVQDGRFEVEAGLTPTTSGIWMYGSPIILSDGSLLLLFDTEGLLRGRDSVTCALSAVASSLATCLIVNHKGGLDNSVHNTCSRLISLVDHTVPKRQLCLWCNDISEEWKNGTGDLKAYLDEHVNECARELTDYYQISLLTSPRPSDEELKILTDNPGAIIKRTGDFAKSLRKCLNTIQEKILAGPLWQSHLVIDSLENKIQSYLAKQGGLFPSLITRIHCQEAEQEIKQVLIPFQQRIDQLTRLVPYFQETYDLKRSAERERQGTIANFSTNSKRLQLPSLILFDYETKLGQETQRRVDNLLHLWNTRLAELEQKRAEREREKKAAELKKQEEEQAKIQAQLYAEQQRLHALHMAQHNQWVEVVNKENALIQQHPILWELLNGHNGRVPDPGSHGKTINWGNGSRNFIGLIRSPLPHQSHYFYATSYS
jgi:hypothetical protein